MEKILNHRFAQRSSVKIIFTILILIISTTALVIYLRNREISNQIFFGEVQNRELVLSKTGANSIELFFNSLKTNVVYISKIEAISSLDEKETRAIYKDFIGRYKNFPFLTISRLDQNAKLIIAERTTGSTQGEGELYSDREYYSWVKNPANKDKVFISKPFIIRTGPSKGKYGISIATPTYSKNKFTGVASIGVVMDKFADVFVTPYRLNKSGDTFIVDKKGIVISASNPSYVNTNLAESFRQALSKKEGKMKSGNYIFAFSSINDQYLLIVSNTKEDLFLSSFWPLSNNQKNWLIIILVTTVTALAILVVVDHVAHRDGFLKGLSQRKKE